MIRKKASGKLKKTTNNRLTKILKNRFGEA